MDSTVLGILTRQRPETDSSSPDQMRNAASSAGCSWTHLHSVRFYYEAGATDIGGGGRWPGVGGGCSGLPAISWGRQPLPAANLSLPPPPPAPGRRCPPPTPKRWQEWVQPLLPSHCPGGRARGRPCLPDVRLSWGSLGAGQRCRAQEGASRAPSAVGGQTPTKRVASTSAAHRPPGVLLRPPPHTQVGTPNTSADPWDSLTCP